MELKQIEDSATSFIANGVTYFIKDSLSIERYRWFEKYQIEFGFGMDYDSLRKLHKKSVDLANKGKGIEAWTVIVNIIEKMDKEPDKTLNSALLLCALYIVEEDEDLTVWEESKANVKIENWNKEGYDSHCFFRLAANLVSGYIQHFEEDFQNISQVAEIAEQVKQSSNNTST